MRKKDRSLSKNLPHKLLFASILGAGLFLVLAILMKSPQGTGLDAWAIWKLKARHLFYGASFWRDYFVPELGFSSRDYPLYYPLALVWGWIGAGKEILGASWTVALVFTLSIAGLLISAIPQKTGRWLAGLLLISTPHFIGMGGSQYADIIVAYFVLAAAILVFRGHFFWAGVFAGIGAYVKNEGLLWAVAVFAAIAAEDRKALFLFFRGLLPGLVLVFWFKAKAACPNGIVSWERLQTLLSPDPWIRRPGMIFSRLLEEFLRENAWVYGWFVIALCFAGKRLAGNRTAGLSLLFLAGGYFMIYMITPLDLADHLNTSLDRLMIHIFPAAVFVAFQELGMLRFPP